MQLWFFFDAGSGGDGVVNLFERSNNIVPFDGETDWWRIHRFVNGNPKFYAPTPDTQGCFRNGLRFDKLTNQLNSGYQQCVTSEKNCVVASHDVTLKALNNSDLQEIFCKNQIRILLTTKESYRCLVNDAVKNLRPTIPKQVKKQAIDQTKFDFVLDVDRVQTDWQYVLDFCNSTKLDLDVEQYLQYQDLLKGNKTYMTNNFGIEEYTSQIVDDKITYTLVDTWQSV